VGGWVHFHEVHDSLNCLVEIKWCALVRAEILHPLDLELWVGVSLIWIHPNLNVVFCFQKWVEIASFSGPCFFSGPPLVRLFGVSRSFWRRGGFGQCGKKSVFVYVFVSKAANAVMVLKDVIRDVVAPMLIHGHEEWG